MEKKFIIYVIVVIGIIGLAIALFPMLAFKSRGEIESFNGEVKEFDVIAKQFSFEPGVIEVNKGDKVILNIKSIDVILELTNFSRKCFAL